VVKVVGEQEGDVETGGSRADLDGSPHAAVIVQAKRFGLFSLIVPGQIMII
jgi:hypothetical protein